MKRHYYHQALRCAFFLILRDSVRDGGWWIVEGRSVGLEGIRWLIVLATW